ncbi:MAG: 1,4-alpha-glucan branching protein GlgB [Ruminococcaceae bacterium]|nr:1,4-alpha-glucan branching protein GlgB [Oscillospiraceae bacterium]
MAKVGDMAAYLFHQGTNYKTYDYLGAHRTDKGMTFRVWAPNAEKIFVVGDFNCWQETHSLERVTRGGVWEVTLPSDDVKLGDKYKYKIYGGGRAVCKADPYAIQSELPPATASVIGDIDNYQWRDSGWLEHRKSKAGNFINEPLNIYELHLGSWKRHEDGTVYTYSEIAAELAPYVKQMGYTHIELMPVMEHPFDGSWGYQVCSYYAPTARYGTPAEFMAFIDSMHEAGIGVILDWVPAHFPKDEHGLYEFDGRPLYEYQGWDRIEHDGWGTRRFDVGRNEVECFLVSNAMFWIEKYHADGLRVDAVASMMYLDYDRLPGQWVPNVNGDNKCLEAIAFFQKLNGWLEGKHPDVMMIAEESTAWANVTRFADGGLGFDAKWNMGWMNDTLSYIAEDPLFRKYHHEKMTFALTYSFNEKYILSISHDEVVHGKKSLIDKMWGDYWQKFAGIRAYLGFMMTHPGKKLLFMGSEFGQFIEWKYDDQLDWFLLEYESHSRLQHYVSELNHLYLRTPAMWEQDGSWDGFKWIDADNKDQSILSYRRIDKKGDEYIVLINFTPVAREDFLMGVPKAGTYEEVINSDSEEFGGSGVVNPGELKSTGMPWNYLPDSIRLRVPPLGMTVIRSKREKQCAGKKKK